MRASSKASALARELRRHLRDAFEDDIAFVPLNSGEPLARGGSGVAQTALTGSREDVFQKLAETIRACRACPLGRARRNAVPGEGSLAADVVFVGEGPGLDEDRLGRPFVGRAGQLLDRILASIGLSRDTVYIANMVKCHPMKDPDSPDSRGNDRPPSPDEMEACRGYIEAQLRLIAPRFIVTLGGVASKALLREETPISKLRGRWREFSLEGLAAPIRLLPTYHPAALLRQPELKRAVWEDMKSLRDALGEPVRP